MHYLVTATPPTPNGDLHLGHLSGPYLAADVFKRFARLRGHEATYVSSADDNQTYVVTTAALEHRPPETVADDYNERIQRSLRLAQIDVDVFNKPDAAHGRLVSKFFSQLLSREKLIVRDTPCLFCEDCKQFVFEAYAGGACPTCLEQTRGNICEACGHPNDPVDLIEPHCSADKTHRLVVKSAPGLFLPLERYRGDIERFYRSQDIGCRTHLLEFVRDILAAPLPQFRLTYPTGWGISSDLPGLGGQRFNAWGEMLPGLVNSFALGGQMCGLEPEGPGFQPAPAHTELVQFFGFDNSFFFAFVHLGLMFACGGECIRPKALICNEFYELENQKFSTGLKHAIWAGDFLERYNADLVRLYLSHTNAELQRTNFVQAEMQSWLEQHVVAPWARVREATGGNFDEAAAQRRFQAYAVRMERYCGAEFFSLRQTARVIVQALKWLSRGDARPTPAILSTLAAFCSPIMPCFADELAASLGLPGVGRWEERHSRVAVAPSQLPALRVGARKASAASAASVN